MPDHISEIRLQGEFCRALFAKLINLGLRVIWHSGENADHFDAAFKGTWNELAPIHKSDSKLLHRALDLLRPDPIYGTSYGFRGQLSHIFALYIRMEYFVLPKSYGVHNKRPEIFGAVFYDCADRFAEILFAKYQK